MGAIKLHSKTKKKSKKHKKKKKMEKILTIIKVNEEKNYLQEKVLKTHRKKINLIN